MRKAEQQRIFEEDQAKKTTIPLTKDKQEGRFTFTIGYMNNNFNTHISKLLNFP